MLTVPDSGAQETEASLTGDPVPRWFTQFPDGRITFVAAVEAVTVSSVSHELTQPREPNPGRTP